MSNKEVEKTQDNIITIEEVQNTIPQLIEEFCISNNIQDLKKESNNVFNACLNEISARLIKPNKRILIVTDDGTNNKTDYYKLNKLLDLYILLCMQYDATVTLIGFSIFTGLKYDTIADLQNQRTHTPQANNITKETHIQRETSPTGSEVYQKLLKFEEQTTLECRKYNDLRIIARLNRITGGAYRDYTQVDTGESKQKLTTEDINNKYGSLESSENTLFLPHTED